MFDTNHNGKVDQVVATFNDILGSCTAPCTTGWTLSNVPSGGTLSSVTVAGTAGTLNLTEGAGAADTSVGSFTVTLANTSGITDATGNHASFAATAPADKANPVPTGIALANGNGTVASGDTATIVWSEPPAVASMCTTWSGNGSNQSESGNSDVIATVSDGGAGNDLFNAVNLATGTAKCGATASVQGVFHFGSVDLGSSAWLTTTRTFSGSGSNKSTIAWTVSTKTVVVMLGAASGVVGSVAGTVTATYTPDPGITDPAGNAAAGSVSASTKF